MIKINQGHLEELIKLTDDRIYWLAWSTIAGVGPISLKRLYQHFGSVAMDWNATDSAIDDSIYVISGDAIEIIKTGSITLTSTQGNI